MSLLTQIGGLGNPTSLYIKGAAVLVVVLAIGWHVHKDNQVKHDLELAQAHVSELQGKLALQNQAIDQMKADADRRAAEGQVLIDKAKQEAQSHEQKAAIIRGRIPLGNDCSAALSLGNEK